ncbi:FUSC family protein [Pseudactinotalea sp. Z1748]|uniref:FUSC family protein n=1 Tax=Pseudactinotalea sp. Z1748 TaxID=3413027 RepID=UPI003C7D0C4D
MKGRVWRRIVNRVRSPEFVTTGIQVLKSTIAATAAWWLAVAVFETELPFLAPWIALLTVHATIYRSLSRGLQTMVASAIGIGLSFVIGAYLGVTLWTFGLALLVGLVAARLRWLRDEGVAIATTAIFVLGSGFGEQAPLLADRLLEVALGVAVGVVVNLVLVPPLWGGRAARYVDSVNRRMGQVLIEIAEELETSWDTARADAWVSETVSITAEVEHASQWVSFARESRRANPRLLTPARPRVRDRRTDRARAGQPTSYEELLERIGEGVSHLRHLARTLREATIAESRWDEVFRQAWVAIVRDAGRSIQDPDAQVEPVHDRLRALAGRLTEGGQLPGSDWPVYGSLITSMEHIALIVDDVASAREARQADRPNPRV